jgi:hypothetical protein
VKIGNLIQKSVNIGEFEDIGRSTILSIKIGEFTEKSVDLASLFLSKARTFARVHTCLDKWEIFTTDILSIVAA